MNYYVYKFINDKEEVIYIGLTTNLKRRLITQHFTKNGHLAEDVYEETKKILYCKCINRDDMKIKERYLINNFSPKYNEKMNNSSTFNFEINDFKWEDFPISKIKRYKDAYKDIYYNINISRLNIEDYTYELVNKENKKIKLSEFCKYNIEDVDIYLYSKRKSYISYQQEELFKAGKVSKINGHTINISTNKIKNAIRLSIYSQDRKYLKKENEFDFVNYIESSVHDSVYIPLDKDDIYSIKTKLYNRSLKLKKAKEKRDNGIIKPKKIRDFLNEIDYSRMGYIRDWWGIKFEVLKIEKLEKTGGIKK